jgi:predicted Zn-dependent peptidase
VAQVQDAFWRMRGYKAPTLTPAPVYHAGVCIEHVPVSQAYFTIGLNAFPYAHPQRYEIHVLNNILGGGISSRLFCRLREERGLVYHIASDYHAYRDAGLLVIEGSSAPESLEQVVSLTLRELWQVATAAEPIDAEELWKAKMHIRGQYLLATEDTHTRMSRLATQELYFGRHLPSEEILAQIERVDGLKLQRLAETFLHATLTQVAVAVVGPEAPEYYSHASLEALICREREGMGSVKQRKEVVACH